MKATHTLIIGLKSQMKKVIQVLLIISGQLAEVIFALKQSEHVPISQIIITKKVLQKELNMCDKTYERRKKDVTLKPRYFGKQEYFYRSDIEAIMNTPEENEKIRRKCNC